MMDRDPKNIGFVQQLKALGEGLQPLMKTLDENLKTFAKCVEPIAEALIPIVLKLERGFSQWDLYREVLGRAGWVPHYTTPFGDIAECGDDMTAVRSSLRDYYKSNWQSVRREIESRLADYKVDSQAKETLCEALDAHEAGFYRCVSRVLFPEIERMFRIELFEDKIGNIRAEEMIKGLVAGESELAKDKYIEDFTPNGIYELALFECLIKVLKEKDEIDNTTSILGIYTSVKTEEERERVKQDPVPNRHAAMHGLVDYSTPQNSLNMIFVADYIFQIISSFKESTCNVICKE